MDYDKANPKWLAWLADQSPEARAAVEAKWAETASDPDTAEARALGGKAYYARLAVLLAWCAETYGYDFT